MKEDNNENRLSRWSRMKTKNKTRTLTREPMATTLETSAFETSALTPEDNTLEPVPADLPLAGELEPIEEEEIIDLDALAETHDLPKIDTLEKDSDFTGFLKTGVPEALKKAAMRKLWLSDSLLAGVDGLNDYDDDFNVIDKLISILDTNYQVGKGMIDPNEEIETSEEGAKEDQTDANAGIPSAEMQADPEQIALKTDEEVNDQAEEKDKSESSIVTPGDA